MSKIARLVPLTFLCPLLGWAQTAAPAGTPVQMTIIIGHHYGHEPPVLTRDDMQVIQNYQTLKVTRLTPLRGDQARTELFFLVDECSNCDPGSRFDQLSRFITSQPATTAVGVAYIFNGKLQIAQEPTNNHESAVKALSTPEGSKPASPFPALAELIRSWPHTNAHRVVLMISNGINPAAKDDTRDPTVDVALKVAQRAGVTVYGLYHPSADYMKTDLSALYQGQVQLAHVADETGGEAYFLGFGPLPTLAPFLSDLADHLANRYVIEFNAIPPAGPSDLEEVTVKSKSPDLEIMAPDRVWVLGGRAGAEDRP